MSHFTTEETRIRDIGALRKACTEQIDLTAIGRIHVRRATHIIYDNANRHWVVTDTLENKLFSHTPHGSSVWSGSRAIWRSAKLSNMEVKLEFSSVPFSNRKQAANFEAYLKSGSGRAFANNRLW
ncbi:MAG: hypothetical protein WC340_14635 [Kiritimatiellia bacterium]